MILNSVSVYPCGTTSSSSHPPWEDVAILSKSIALEGTIERGKKSLSEDNMKGPSFDVEDQELQVVELSELVHSLVLDSAHHHHHPQEMLSCSPSHV